MTGEGYVKDVVKKLLESYNIHPAKSAGKQIEKQDGWYFMPVTTGRGVAGIPDFIGCYCGRLFAIETKGSRKQNATKFQLMQLDAIERGGGKTFIVRDTCDCLWVKMWLDNVPFKRYQT